MAAKGMVDRIVDWAVVREAVGAGRLSVVMPVYNLAGEIGTNIARTARLFEEHHVPAELVVVDDGSFDSTAFEISCAICERYEGVEIKSVLMVKNGGKGAALKAGFAASTGEFVMLLDGDLDIHPEQTPCFFEALLRSQADVVVGSKRHRDSVVQYPWHRRIVSWAYFTLVRFFVGLPITDTQTGMKLFRREILSEALARMLVKEYAFDLELLAIARQRGARIVEAPVVIRFGTKFGALKPRTVIAMAKDSLAVFYRLRILRYYAKAPAPTAPKGDLKFSVVIACPGRSWMLDECLSGLQEQTFRNFEVIVLPDEDVDLGRAANGFDLKTIPTGKVRPAEKRNIGIEAASGDVVAFIDDDAYPDVRWLEYAVRYFGESSIAALGGPGVSPRGDSFMAEAGGRVYSSPLVSGGYRYRYEAGGVCRDVDDYPSCNLFVRREVLKEIGGYRTDFWPGEDTLLCKDILDAGYRIVYDPWVVVSHHRRPLFAPHLRQIGRYAFHRGYFVKRYPSNSLRIAYFLPSMFALYCAGLSVFCLLPVPSMLKAVAVLPLAVYLFLAALASFSFNPLMWILVFLGIVLTHLVYGVHFLVGLLASRAPCEFIGTDHASCLKK
ncbi:MAG: glycosyltransferase [Kiritimatiellae bacterium]|nr:glycosyltransferase [Kiritimatiellia bacterium]